MSLHHIAGARDGRSVVIRSTRETTALGCRGSGPAGCVAGFLGSRSAGRVGMPGGRDVLRLLCMQGTAEYRSNVAGDTTCHR